MAVSGVDVDIPGRSAEDADWPRRQVDDEFRAASHIAAQDSGGFVEDCGGMPLVEHSAKEEEAFIGDRVDEIKK